MALPALITAGSALTIAVAPQVAVPIVSAYAANMAVRSAFRTAEYKVQKDNSAALQAIAQNTETIANRVYDSENSLNLAEAVQRKPSMPDELHLHINMDDPETSTDERWTASG